ncbi:unnamed protein product [Trifolium pratense]|uniref:Uncharacterized protein n=2 Tax=Trifolium pratense TaxID=57577 RepID=A0ACB0KAJ0_TRIPR|nr:unnamed protein product [Trifolium pratense]
MFESYNQEALLTSCKFNNVFLQIITKQLEAQCMVQATFQNNPHVNTFNLGVKNHMNCSYGANPNQAFPQDQHYEDHLESFEDTLILAMKMTQGNFEVMKANQEVSSERHEASIKNLENQIGQLARQVSSLQTQSGFCGNTPDPPNESCNSINLRNIEVSSPEVVENPKKDESKNGVVEKMRDDVVENKKESKKEEKNKEGEVEKRVENESSAKKGKKPLVKDPKFQVPSPYARMPYPRMKRVKNQDLEVCGGVSECFKVEVLEEVVKDEKEEEWDHEIEIFLQNLDNPLEEEKEPKAMKKPPELKELPPKWKYVFLGGDSRKPMIISDLLTPLEENYLLKEAEKVNDDLGWDLDGVVPIYCLHKMAKEEEPDPVVNPQKSSTSTLKASVRKGSKKSPSRSSKKERTNLKTKGEDLKSDSGSVKSLPIDINIAPLNEENKRSRGNSFRCQVSIGLEMKTANGAITHEGSSNMKIPDKYILKGSTRTKRNQYTVTCIRCGTLGHNKRSCNGKTAADRMIPKGGNKSNATMNQPGPSATTRHAPTATKSKGPVATGTKGPAATGPSGLRRSPRKRKNDNTTPNVITPSAATIPSGQRKSARITTNAVDPIGTQQSVNKP